MGLSSSSSAIRELITEINILRQHIPWSIKGASPQLQREIIKVRSDVVSALEKYNASKDDRLFLEKSFRELGQLQDELSNASFAHKDNSGIKSFVEKLDKKCCSIQMYLSDLELPSLSST